MSAASPSPEADPPLASARSALQPQKGRPVFDPTALLSRIWRQNLPIVQDRVVCLERAAEHAAAGSLTPERRTEAADTAHKLAGSLGMFGYPQGTDIARAVEEHLEAPGPVLPELLLRLSAELRAALPLNPTP